MNQQYLEMLQRIDSSNINSHQKSAAYTIAGIWNQVKEAEEAGETGSQFLQRTLLELLAND